jgi:hypothetical protein
MYGLAAALARPIKQSQCQAAAFMDGVGDLR